MVYKSREDHKKLRSTFNSLSRKINTYTEITFYSVSVFPRYLNLTYACTEGLKNDLLRIPLHQMKNSWKDGIAQVHNLSFARKRIIFVSDLGKEGCFFSVHNNQVVFHSRFLILVFVKFKSRNTGVELQCGCRFGKCVQWRLFL